MQGNMQNIPDVLILQEDPNVKKEKEVPVKKKKSKKGFTFFLVFILVVAATVGAFLYFHKGEEKETTISNNSEDDSSSNTKNEVRSDKVALIAEDIILLKQYGDYFEIERDGEYFVLDSKGNTVLENPLYLGYALADGKAVYKGKPLVVSGTFEKYKVYSSSDNPELGYVVIFNDVLEYQSNKVQDFYIGGDIVITTYQNQSTEENFIVKYNIKTGSVLTEGIVDGYLDFFSWNGKSYLSVSHSNIVDLDSLNKVFKNEYILGDATYDVESDKLVSANNKYLTANLDGKYGIIDANEKVIIPFDYISLKQINNDVIVAKTKDGYGVIDYRNQKVLDFNYDKLDIYDNYIVTVDHSGILRVFNNQYETLFIGSLKILIDSEYGTYSSQNIREDWNILAYYNMVTGLDTSYFAIIDVSSGKTKEILDYNDYAKVNRSPSGYGYVVFMSDDNFSVYDGIVEVSKVNVSDYKFTSVDSFYYVGNDYIVFNAKTEDDAQEKQYFINMKKNIIETEEIVDIKKDEILTYDELFANDYFLKYENDRINIYDSSNNLLCSIVGDSIELLDALDKTYYQIRNEDKVTIIRIN